MSKPEQPEKAMKKNISENIYEKVQDCSAPEVMRFLPYAMIHTRKEERL